MILISKADLFSAADREQMIAYVKANLRSELRIGPPVHAVSVFGADAALCDRWFEIELRPFLAQHHEFAVISQKRKIGGLREAVIGALGPRLQAAPESGLGQPSDISEEATEALRSGDRILERAQGECFFVTKKIPKMQRAIIDVAAERIAAAVTESDGVEVSSIFSETLTQMLAEPVAATLRSLEQTRDALVKAMDVVASTSGREASEELPKLTGMPMVDVNEISRIIVIEKPRILSLLGRSMLVSHVRRKLATVYDRALLEFLSLYANRLRRWMEQSINALRNAFNAFADIHRAHFEAPLAAAGATDPSAIQNDLRVLRQWGKVGSGRGHQQLIFAPIAGQAHRLAYSMLIGIPQYSR